MPGVSGNPTGRPTIAKEIRDLATCDSAEAYTKIKALMQSDGHKQQLAAAIAVLKIAGVAMNAGDAPQTGGAEPVNPAASGQTPAALMEGLGPTEPLN